MEKLVLEMVFLHPIWPMPGATYGKIKQILIVVMMVILDFNRKIIK
jgi:hypothetical protein